MALSDLEREFGMQSFQVRGGYREVVFERRGKWWLYLNDRQGRLCEKRALLSFAEVEAALSGQPNALSDARELEEDGSATVRLGGS